MTPVESATQSEQVTEQAAALAALSARFPSVRVNRIEHCSGGYSHANYRLDSNLGDFAVRLPSPALEAAPIEQRWLSEWAVELSVELVHWEPSGLMITRWRDWPALSQQQAPALDCCLALLTTLASLPVSPAVPVHGLAQRIEQYLVAGRAPKAAFEALSDTPAPAGDVVVSHNDLNPDNLLFRSGDWCVLDWEWAGLNYPGFDAATLYAGLIDPGFDFAQLTPSLNPTERVLAQRWFDLREYAFAIATLAANPQPAVKAALIGQRDRFASKLALPVD